MHSVTSARTHIRRLALIVAVVLSLLSGLGPGSQPALAAIQVPDVTARGVYAFDLDTGIKLFAKNEHERMAIGSLVKVVTALVVVEHANLDDRVTITEGDLVDTAQYSNMNLQAGDTLTVSQLLYGLMIPSGSDGANALARHVGGILSGSDDAIAQLDAFVAEMNALISRNGLSNSRFTNPHGIDAPNNFSTAYDIAVLSGLLVENEFLARVVAEPGYSLASVGPESRQYQGATTNQLLGQSGVVGVKTGSTGEAGGCVVLARQVNGGSSTVVTAVLGSDLAYDDNGMIAEDVRWNDASELLQFMDASFAWMPLSDAETFVTLPTELAIWDVQVAGNPTIPVATGEETQTRYQLALDPEGGGAIDIYYDQERVGSLPLEPAAIARGGMVLSA